MQNQKKIDWQRAYYKRNKERINYNRMKYHLFHSYGITPEEYDKLVVKQDGKCALCDRVSNQNKPYGRLQVDHDHLTGKVRGLLCVQCNVDLGRFETMLPRLDEIVEYLAKGRI